MTKSSIRRFLRELRRRKVFRTAGAYLVVGWAAIEVADTVAPMMSLPEWVPRLVLLLVILGFPLTLALAWAFDVTSEGVQRAEAPVGDDGAGPASSWSVTRLATQVLVGIGVLAGAGAGVWYLTGAGVGEPDRLDRAVAVLPFETLGASRASAFTEGVHAGILTRLSGVAGLDVISRTSVLRYRSGQKSLPEIATELGVGWVVRGEVQEAGDQVLVNVRLADARRDRQIWAEAYRRELTAENVFQIQGDIARTIIGSLEAHLTPAEEERVHRTPTQNLQAYRLYAQGRQLLDERDEEMARSLDYFRRAIQEDSSYALAWVGLADALTLLTSYGYPAPDRALEEAEQAVRRALELDPRLAEAHASLGMLHETQRRGPEALAALDRAVELRPSYGEAQSWRSWVNLLMGNQEQSLASARRAVEIDPLHLEGRHNLAIALIAKGEVDQAVVETERIREIYPESGTLRVLHGVALYHAGRYEEAKPLLRGPPVPWAGVGPDLTLALADLATGDTAAARNALERMVADEQWFAAGVLFAALDDRERAFQAFDHVDNWGDYWPGLSIHHLYPEIRDRLAHDPRYREIIRRVRLAWRQ